MTDRGTASRGGRLGRRGVFHGWWIALAALVLNLFHGGAFTYGFSLFVAPLAATFGWSRSSISAVWSGALLLGLLLGPPVGYLTDRGGGRAMVWAGLPAFGLAYMAMPWLDRYWLFCLVVVTLLGFGLAAGIYAPGEAEITYWFRRRRGFAMGIATSGIGVAGVTIVPGLAWVIAHHGWRVAALALGGLIVAAAYPLGLVFRGRPEAHGQHVDGVAPAAPTSPGKQVGDVADEPIYSAREAFSTPAFWFLNLAFGLRWLGVSMVSVHQVPYLVSAGFSPVTAASALGAALAVSAPSRLLLGWLGDRTGLRLWLIVSFLLQGVSLLCLLSAGRVWTLPLYALLFGVGSAALPLSSALVGQYFGRRSYASIQGAGRPFSQVGRVLGAMAGGVAFDATGTYRGAFLFTALAFVLGTLFVALARRPDSTGVRRDAANAVAGGQGQDGRLERLV